MILNRSSLTVRLVILTVLALGVGLVALLLAQPCRSSCATSTTRQPSVTVAVPKPALLVERPSGESIALDEIAPGKRVAVIVMKGNWCPVCRDQLVRLQAQIDAIESADAVIVGMTTSTPSENEAVARRLGLDFPILSDQDGDAILSFGLDGPRHPVPGVAFLDEQGTVTDVVCGRYPGRPQEQWIIERLLAAR